LTAIIRAPSLSIEDNTTLPGFRGSRCAVPRFPSVSQVTLAHLNIHLDFKRKTEKQNDSTQQSLEYQNQSNAPGLSHNLTPSPGGGGGIFLSGKKPLNGYLDHLRENVKNLDSAILEVRKGPEGEKPAEKRARLKLLRDLTELQNSTLTAIKTHMLGRDETGVATEPTDYYDESSNPLFEFERAFKNFLEPWTEEDLEYECEDCGKSSQEVELRTNVVV
jgi:hypothetical protein